MSENMKEQLRSEEISESAFQRAKDSLTEFLKKNIVKITFQKQDGTLRVMLCTLHPDLLPDITESKETVDAEGFTKKKRTKKPNPEVLPVYDLEKKAWRSFRIDSVQNVEISVNANIENGIL